MAKNFAAAKRLQQEALDLRKEKVAGFTIEVDEQNIFIWRVKVFGPPETLYSGGYFKGVLEFPSDYPFSPPKFKFLTKMWHPNIYFDSGEVCISILHSPVPDQQSGEKAEERWRPTQGARTILLSVISLFSCPNTSSPANVDASVSYRKWKDNVDDEYAKVVRKQVKASRREADAEGIVIPSTVEEYLKEERSTVVQEEVLDFDFGSFSDSEYSEDDGSYVSSTSDAEDGAVGGRDGNDSGTEEDPALQIAMAGTPTNDTPTALQAKKRFFENPQPTNPYPSQSSSSSTYF